VRQLELTERILRLRSVPTLRALPASVIAQLAGSLRTVTFRRGDVLLREDEPPRSFFLIATGTVTLRRRGKRFGTVRGPGGVGFMSYLARHQGGTSAVAESFVEALEVPADAMDEVIEDHFAVLLGQVRWVAERLIAENRATAPPPYVPPVVPFDAMIGDAEIGIVERIFLLRRMNAFTEANVNSLATLARKLVEVRAPVGEVLWRPGDVADHTYFVVKGMLTLRWGEGEEERIQEVGPGYALGGAESLVGLPRWNQLVTEEPVILLRGTRDGLIDLFEDDPELAVKFLAMLATLLVSIWDRKAEEGITSVGSADSEPPPPVEVSPAGVPSTAPSARSLP
jgi:CRP-like cAMP-binding protein